MSGPDLSDYVEVAERIDHFKAAHPDGTLQSEIVSLTESLVVVKAYAYRTPDDPRPGVGLASEPIPGTTPFTRGSELMNAETSAWGRAIVATGASRTKRIATVEDVQARQGDDLAVLMGRVGELIAACQEAGAEGDFNKTFEWAGKSAANARAAISKLEKVLP